MVDLFDKLSAKSIKSLFCSDGSSADSVLANLVKYGDVAGVNDFSRLMRYVGPRIGFGIIDEILVKDKGVFEGALACGETSMVQALSWMYSNLNSFAGFVAALASSRGIASAIKHGHVDTLKIYCEIIKSGHLLWNEKEKSLILKAMRNAELRGIVFHAQSPEFVKLCKENPDFYGIFKSTKNVLKT